MIENFKAEDQAIYKCRGASLDMIDEQTIELEFNKQGKLEYADMKFAESYDYDLYESVNWGSIVHVHNFAVEKIILPEEIL